MAELTVNVPIHEVAQLINRMSKEEIETLCLLLSEDGKELIERKQDLIAGKTEYLTRDQVFDV